MPWSAVGDRGVDDEHQHRSRRGRTDLAAEYRRLVELNRSRDRFLHTVSHELRTPLTSISCTGLLTDERTGPLNPDQRGYVDIVGRNAGRLLRLVEDLLEPAGLESASQPFRDASVRRYPRGRRALACTPRFSWRRPRPRPARRSPRRPPGSAPRP